MQIAVYGPLIRLWNQWQSLYAQSQFLMLLQNFDQ